MNEKIVQDNWNNWKELLRMRDVQKISQLYSLDALLLATMQGGMLHHQDISRYFETFLKTEPIVKIEKEKWKILGATSYLHVGCYIFKVKQHNTTTNVSARFTFIWKHVDHEKRWEIIHHHSSIQP